MSISKRLAKYSTAGLVQTASVQLVNSTKGLQAGNVPIGGSSVPWYVVTFGAGAVSSWLADMAHSYILPSIPVGQKVQNIASAGTALATGAAASYGSYYALGMLGPDFTGMNAMEVGAISEIASDYLWGNWVDPLLFGDAPSGLSY